jgi:hypothetical protein
MLVLPSRLKSSPVMCELLPMPEGRVVERSRASPRKREQLAHGADGNRRMNGDRVATVDRSEIGTKSLNGSYRALLYRIVLVTKGLLWSIRVYPSGADRATISEPIMPEAPPRLSTTICWPSTRRT